MARLPTAETLERDKKKLEQLQNRIAQKEKALEAATKAKEKQQSYVIGRGIILSDITADEWAVVKAILSRAPLTAYEAKQAADWLASVEPVSSKEAKESGA